MSESANVAEIPARKQAKLEKVPTRNPDPQYCSYYVTRKHRFCRTECKPGSLYCCTHHVAPASSSTGREEAKSALTAQQSSVTLSNDEQDSTAVDERSGISGNTATTSNKAAGSDERVPCPINPNHTVYASRLAKHVKVCPDLRFVTDQLPYFCLDKHANKGACFVAHSAQLTGAEASGSARRTHRDLSAEDLAALIAKVDACYSSAVEPELVVMPGLTATEAATEETNNAPLPPPTSSSTSSAAAPGVGASAHAETASQKHGPQHQALLQCLNDIVLQSDSTAPADSILTRYYQQTHVQPLAPSARSSHAFFVDGFMEFGAGKGGLSVALQQLLVQRNGVAARADVGGEEGSTVALSASSSSLPFLACVTQEPPLVVLDMDGFRRKGDARVRHSALPLQRLRINIKDVDLAAAFATEVCPHGEKRNVNPHKSDDIVEKKDAQEKLKETGLKNWAALGKHLCGACTDFALSCLTEAPSLAAKVQVRLPIVVIATCCHHRCELKHLNPPESQETAENGAAVLRMPGTDVTWSEAEFAALASMSSWAVCGGFVDERRRRTGWQCKRIIDQLRVHFLRQLGYVAFLCQYTTREVTEENVCLVAFQPAAAQK